MMKKSVFYLLLTTVLGFMVFPSCSKDDDEPDYAAQIAKTYDGYLTILGSTASRETVIERSGENKINLTLKDFSYSGYSLGDIVLNNINIKKIDSIRFSVDAQTITLNDKSTVTVSLEGTALNGELNLTIVISTSSIPVAATFTTKEPEGYGPIAEGGNLWSNMDGEYEGDLTLSTDTTIHKNITVTKMGGYYIQVDIDKVSFVPGKMPEMAISFPDILVTEDKETGVCTFTGAIEIIPQTGMTATITGAVEESGTIQFTVSAMGYTASYNGELSVSE